MDRLRSLWGKALQAGLIAAALAAISWGVQADGVEAEQNSGTVYVPAREKGKMCGVNCLYLLCTHYGIGISYDNLASLLSPRELGSSMAELVEVGRGLGFEIRPIETNGEGLLLLKGPLIVRVAEKSETSLRNGHWVVVVSSSSGDGAWVFDPPQQPEWRARIQGQPVEPERAQALVLRFGRGHSSNGMLGSVSGSIRQQNASHPSADRLVSSVGGMSMKEGIRLGGAGIGGAMVGWAVLVMSRRRLTRPDETDGAD